MEKSKFFVSVVLVMFALNLSYAQQEKVYTVSVSVKNSDSIAARTEVDMKMVEKFTSSIYKDIIDGNLFTTEEVKLEENKARVMELISSEMKIDMEEEKWTGKKYSLKGNVSTDIYLLAKNVEKRFAEPVQEPQNGGGGAAAITIVNPDGSEVALETKEQTEEKKELSEAEMMAARSYFQKAMDAHSVKNYNEAIENYQRGVEIDATSAEPFFKMGNAFYELNRFDEAITAYEKALALQPDYVDVIFNLGNSYLEKSNFTKAIEAYEKVVTLDPKNSDAYYNMGVALFQNGDQQNAIEAFKNAARQGSRDAQLWLNANKLTW